MKASANTDNMSKLFPALRDKDSTRMLGRVTQPPYCRAVSIYECSMIDFCILKIKHNNHEKNNWIITCGTIKLLKG